MLPLDPVWRAKKVGKVNRDEHKSELGRSVVAGGIERSKRRHRRRPHPPKHDEKASLASRTVELVAVAPPSLDPRLKLSVMEALSLLCTFRSTEASGRNFS